MSDFRSATLIIDDLVVDVIEAGMILHKDGEQVMITRHQAAGLQSVIHMLRDGAPMPKIEALRVMLN